MKVLLINGSPHIDGSTKLALHEIEKVLNVEGIQTEIVEVGKEIIRGCIACKYCKNNGRCVFDDLVNETAEKFKDADGIVIGTPVYYSNVNGTLLSFLQRLFYSTNFSKKMKVGSSIISARRAGTTASFDEINKFFTISEMPIVSSQYWNNIHGNNKEEASKDLEGLQTMRVLGKNMAFLIKSIKLGLEKFDYPTINEKRVLTNFIDKK